MTEYHIYTDGSHLDKLNNGRLGCGGVIVKDGKALDTFSVELPANFMKEKFGSDTCSNPSAELVAVYFALNAFEKYLKGADSIIIHADYMGVGSWMTGAWKTKEPYIKAIKETNIKEIQRQKLNGKIKYSWVRGHQSNPEPGSDAYWNNYVDKLAKGEKPNG